MIDPREMTKYDCTDNELEERILFSCCVAGKNAMSTARGLHSFFNTIECFSIFKSSPFKQIQCVKSRFGYDFIIETLKRSGIGCYNNRARTFSDLIDKKLDLKTCSVKDLEEVWGIGEKTSRFFILHTRPNVRYAALDTHIRKHMESLGIKFPKGQPKGKRYKKLEDDFLRLADQSGMTVAEYDLHLWNLYAGHKNEITV